MFGGELAGRLPFRVLGVAAAELELLVRAIVLRGDASWRLPRWMASSAATTTTAAEENQDQDRAELAQSVQNCPGLTTANSEARGCRLDFT